MTKRYEVKNFGGRPFGFAITDNLRMGEFEGVEYPTIICATASEEDATVICDLLNSKHEKELH